MQPTDIDILTLIPQRPPFVMVDRLLHYDPVHTVTSYIVPAAGIFVEQGRLTPPGIAENIAQTCAARMGYINLQAGQTVKLGVIGAIRNLVFHSLPSVGATLTTRITLLEEVFQMTLVDAEVRADDILVATARMKIALTDTDAQPPISTAL